MTALRTSRLSGSNGAVAVVAAVAGSPFLEAWLFNKFPADASPWSTKYTAPGSPPGFSTRGISVAVGSANAECVICGDGNVNLFNYPVDSPGDTTPGFGSATQTNVTSAPFSVNFNKFGTSLLVSGDDGLSEYAYASGAIGAETYNIASTFGANFRQSRFLWEDSLIAVSFTSGSSFVTYDTSTSPPTFVQLSPNHGVPITMSLSPQVLADGTRALSLPVSGGGHTLKRISSTGAIGASISFTPSSTILSSIFDPYGRLITLETSTPKLAIYTQASSGSMTQLATSTALDSIGTPDSLAYDKDNDILFVGSSSSVYIWAIPLTGKGFGSIFTSPTAATGLVYGISLLYDERWKNFNT